MNHSEQDEIDLGQLLLKLVRVFSKYKIGIIISIFVGAFAGYGYYSIKTPIYESSMMLRSNILTEAYSITLTNNLKKLIDEQGYRALAEKLNLSLEEAPALRDIKVESVETSGSEALAKNSIFLISVEITDNGILTNLENGIVQYLENNEYVKKRIELDRNRNLVLLEKVRKDIREMDSLKNSVLQGKLYTAISGNNVAFFDPTDIYEKIMLLNKEEVSYLQNLELINSIQLIEGFTAFERPISPKRLVSIASGGLLAFFVMLIFIFVMEIKSYTKKLESEQV